MTRRRKILLAQLAIIGAVPVILYAYAQGPDAGTAGVPGETTCAACHGGGSGTGNVTVTFPNGQSYTPGVTQHLVVTITDNKARRWGFELTARQASSTTTQAGTFAPTDGNTQLVCTQSTFRTEQFGNTCPSSMPLEYIEHTLAGTRLGTTGSVTFAFDWKPPATDVGNINIYVAANAANGDNNTTGDTIHTAHYTLTAAQANLPTITAVVNGAGFQPGIAPGSWVTITGTNLASSTRTWRADEIVNGQLPTQLDNVSVTINGKSASVYYISPAQLNVQAPDDSATGPVNVVVTNNGATSAAFSATLAEVSPACFLWAGKDPVATRYPDNVDVGPAGLFSGVTTTPAKPGDVITLWTTGLGPTNPATPSGWVVSTAAPTVDVPSVTIGGVPAQVLGAAVSPGSAGLYQINIIVPSLPNGDQPIVVQAGGVSSPPGPVLSIQN
jgi:uncharacterized protein (TIGR03437 family)